jgi:hypothetical protein
MDLHQRSTQKKLPTADWAICPTASFEILQAWKLKQEKKERQILPDASFQILFRLKQKIKKENHLIQNRTEVIIC